MGEQMPSYMRGSHDMQRLERGEIHRLDMVHPVHGQAALFRVDEGNGQCSYRLYHINHNETITDHSKWTNYHQLSSLWKDQWLPVSSVERTL